MSRNKVLAVNEIIYITKVTWLEAMAKFLMEPTKYGRARAEYTLEDYKQHISTFYERFNGVFGDFEKDREALIKYLQTGIRQQEIGDVTYNRRLTYLRAFWTWCITMRYLERDPSEGFVKRHEEIREIYSNFAVRNAS